MERVDCITAMVSITTLAYLREKEDIVVLIGEVGGKEEETCGLSRGCRIYPA